MNGSEWLFRSLPTVAPLQTVLLEAFVGSILLSQRRSQHRKLFYHYKGIHPSLVWRSFCETMWFLGMVI